MVYEYLSRVIVGIRAIVIDLHSLLLNIVQPSSLFGFENG